MLKTPDTKLLRTVAEGTKAMNVIAGKPVDAISGERLDIVCPSDGAAFRLDPALRRCRCRRRRPRRARGFRERPVAAHDRDRARPHPHAARRTGRRASRRTRRARIARHRQARPPGRRRRHRRDPLLRILRRRGRQGAWRQIPFLDGYTAFTTREPHGVVAGIIPWNYPLQILARVAGAALAMGNTLVVKPAEDASLTTVCIAELALEAGCPPGVFNVVTGYGAEAGAALSAHPQVDYVTFTGSPATGTAIQCAAAQNNRGVTMELGGKSPQIVFADADLDAALPVVVNAIIQNGGQTCSAGSRVLIEKPVYEDVAAELAKRFSELVAEPHYADGDLGPLINARQAMRVAAMIADAEKSGIPVLARGSVADDAPTGGHYQPPVLFGPVDPRAEIAREEVFGPVLAAFVFEGEDEAVRLANGTDYGLVAGVWTRDGGRQHRVAKRVRAGQVYVNGYGAGGGIELPFGGFGKSGHGREKGFEALTDMSATKTTVFNHG
jgi:aldehyde dehydrogenase (NAD+)